MMMYPRAFLTVLWLLVAGMLPAGTMAPVYAQDLEPGIWQALMLSPQGEIEEAYFHVERSGGVVKAFMDWRTGKVQVTELQLEDGQLSFSWNPYFYMDCRFEHEASGQYTGSCRDLNGEIGPAALSPPDVALRLEDLDLEQALGVWGLTRDEYLNRSRPRNTARALQELEKELVPTRQIPVGARSVTVASLGQQGLTVVLESGFADDHSVWEDVQTKVAERARVVSYDRPGLGTSAPSDEEKTPERQAETLREVLKESGHEPPYVLVGHGSAAFALRRYIEMYPSDVGGLILVDPAHEREDDAWTAIDGDSWRSYVDGKRSFLGAVSPAAKSEFDGYLEVLEAWDERTSPDVPNIPAIVLSAGRAGESPGWVGETEQGLKAKTAIQQSLADELGAEFRKVDGSSGYLHLEDPGEVVDAIQAVLDAVESGS